MTNPLSALPAMLIIWAVVTVCFLLLLAYRGQITRYEEDQLFLNDAHTNEEKEQNEIVRKVNRLAPLIRVFGGAASLATLCIVGLFAYDAWQHLK
jgi:cyanate permease